MEYYSLNQYLKDTFGEKVYKVAIDGGFTCPNRDGTIDTRGCSFCSGAGAGEFAADRHLSVSKQLEQGKLRVAKKNPNGKIIAYFQAFTNTYAPVNSLRTLYEEALSHPDVVALSIATRPDCLPEEVVRLLEELNQRKPVWIELGLQTIHERTAERIRRGYPLSVYTAAVERLKKAKLTVITHVILGLPGETKEDMKETVAFVGQTGTSGIKLQLLHVIRGTDLEKEYRAGMFSTMEMEEYVSLVADCITLLPKEMVIHRMTGDGDKRTLVAPLWSGDKKRVLNALQKELKSR